MTTNSQTLMTDGANNIDAVQQQSTEGAQATTAETTTQNTASADGAQAATTDTGNNEGGNTEGDETEGDQAGGKKPEGAPEKYEFTNPEGVEFDSEVLAPYTEVAKELGLSQEAAQKILDKMGPTIQARQQAAIEATHGEWKNQTTTDKEIGGDKLAENLAVAKKALDTFGTPELRDLLVQTGLGNHPEIIRAFFRAGKQISEDSVVMGGNKTAPRDPAEILFPTMKKT